MDGLTGGVLNAAKHGDKSRLRNGKSWQILPYASYVCHICAEIKMLPRRFAMSDYERPEPMSQPPRNERCLPTLSASEDEDEPSLRSPRSRLTRMRVDRDVVSIDLDEFTSRRQHLLRGVDSQSPLGSQVHPQAPRPRSSQGHRYP